MFLCEVRADSAFPIDPNAPRIFASSGRCDSPCRHQEDHTRNGIQTKEVVHDSFAALLTVCAQKKDLVKGKRLHDDIVERGLLEHDVYVGSALVNMYAKFGDHAKAQEVFDELPLRTVVSWNGLIAGYAQYGQGKKAINCFERMCLLGPSPNAVTFVCTLKACSNAGAIEVGQQIHAKIIEKGLLHQNVVVGNALVDMYVKCGILAKAVQMFYELPLRDAVSWNVIITGFSQNELFENAIDSFGQMILEGITPDPVSFSCVLRACANIGASNKGEEIHAAIVRGGSFGKDDIVGTALVDMYAKCGALAKAQEVFDEISVQSTALWTALVAGYAQLGKDAIAFNLFRKMIGGDNEPDYVTFTTLLKICSHAGLVDLAHLYFGFMSMAYYISPNIEHYACIIDLYGRSGHLDMVMLLIETMPFGPNHMIWLSLLNACSKWGIVNLAALVFKNAVKLAEENSMAYVFMSNIYGAADQQL